MSQYLSEVMDRLSIGGLTALFFFLFICLLISILTSKKTATKQESKSAIPCPMCGQEVNQ